MKITDVEAIIVRQPDGITFIGDGTQDTVIVLVHTNATPAQYGRGGVPHLSQRAGQA